MRHTLILYIQYMDDTNNKELNPTVPTKNTFEANQIPKPERDTSAALDSASSPQVSMKKEIVVRHRRFPSGIVFGLIGIVVLLLVVAFIAKIIASRNAMNGPITLTWWSIEEDSDALTPIISEYEQQHPNIKIQFVSESKQDYALRLTNALANGKGPDIFEFHNTWVPMFAGNLSFVKDNFSSIFYPVVTTNLKTNSGFVGIPLEYDGIALFVNNDILNTYGKNPPKTWDDFRSLAQTLTVRDSSGVIQQGGAGIGVTTNVDYWQDVLGLLLLQNGTDPTTPFSTFGSSALTFYTNFSKTDHVWDSTLPSSTLDFSTGHLGMYFGKYS